MEKGSVSLIVRFNYFGAFRDLEEEERGGVYPIPRSRLALRDQFRDRHVKIYTLLLVSRCLGEGKRKRTKS